MQSKSFHVSVVSIVVTVWMSGLLVPLHPCPAQTYRLSTPPELDRSKAFLRISEIEPRPQPPPRAAEAPPLPDRAVEPIAASRKLIADQRFTEAALELERALRFAPSHPQIHANLAMLHWQAGNLERAKSHAALTVEGDPQSVPGRYILARTLAAAGDRQGAMREMRLAMLCAGFADDPELAALVHFHLAEMLAAERYLTAAIEQYDAFGAASSKAAAAPRGELASLLSTRRGSVDQARAEMLERLGRHEDAARALGPIAEKSPDDVPLQIRYAKLLLESRKPQEAAAVLTRVRSDDEKVLDLLIEIRKQAGQGDLLIDDLRARAAAAPDSAAIAIRLATALVENGQVDQAQSMLSAFLENHPDQPAIRQMQLDLLVRAQRWDEALKLGADKLRADPSSEKEVEAILAAVRATPESLEGVLKSVPADSTDSIHLYLLGRVAVDGGRMDVAERLFRKALDADAGFVPARAALGELLIESCRLEEAAKVVVRPNPEQAEHAQLERVLGLFHDRLDELDKAELHYRTASQLDRGDLRSMYALASVYRRSRKPMQAQKALRALLEIQPDHEQARELLALSLLEDGKGESARQEYVHLEKITQKATTKARCAILLNNELRNDPAQRRKILLDAIETGGPDAATWAALAESYEDSEPAKAREYFAKAVELDPADEDSQMGILRSCQHELNFEKVAEGLEQLLVCRPNRHSWRRMLIGMYSLLEQFDRAVNLAEEFAARDIEESRRTEYREILVESLREAGRPDEAVARLREWAQVPSQEKEWSLRLAAELARQRKFDQSAQLLEELVRKDPDDRALRDRLLGTLESADRHDRAAQYLVEWFAEDPQNEAIVAALAQVLAQGGRVDQAVGLIQAWLIQSSRRERLQNVWLTILISSGRHDDGVQLLEELADEIMGVIRFGGDPVRMAGPDQLTDDRRMRLPDGSTPDQLHGRLERLRLYRIFALISARNFREAQALLDEMNRPDADPNLRLELMSRQTALYRASGEEDRAIETMQAALPLRANTETLNNDIAYSWIDRGIRLDEAEPLIRYALGRVPRQAAYLDTYGWLLYKKSDFEGARVWLGRANRVRGGDDPVIFDHMGDALWRLGRRNDAVEQWKTAVNLVKDRAEHELTNDDERRVKRTTHEKVADAEAGREPNVATVGGEPKVPEPRP